MQGQAKHFEVTFFVTNNIATNHFWNINACLQPLLEEATKKICNSA